MNEEKRTSDAPTALFVGVFYSDGSAFRLEGDSAHDAASLLRTRFGGMPSARDAWRKFSILECAAADIPVHLLPEALRPTSVDDAKKSRFCRFYIGLEAVPIEFVGPKKEG